MAARSPYCQNNHPKSIEAHRLRIKAVVIRAGVARAPAPIAAGRCPFKFPLIGDVRGSGLFWGLELVRDPETLEPAGVEATLIANRLRDQGVLIGTDGPLHNVLKIRPPMPFNKENADHLVARLGHVLRMEF